MGLGASVIIAPEPDRPEGARLYLAPVGGSYATGATLTVQIRVDSLAEDVNTFHANISYPTDRLQWVSTNSSGSAFTTVIQNTEDSGVLRYGAGILGGSTSGDQLGAVVTFTALSSGPATLNFEAGSGIARTSDSTDICQYRDGANYTIT